MILTNTAAHEVTINPPQYLNEPPITVPAGGTAAAPDYIWDIMDKGLLSLGLTASFGGGTGGAPAVTNNWNATAAPTAADDSAAGYAVESRWYDNAAHDLYVCVSATPAAAVWHVISDDVQNALNAVAAPTAVNDVTQGYTAGSIWIDTVASQAYICISSTIGAAVWASQTSTISPASSFDTIAPTVTIAAGTPITALTVALGASAAAFNGNTVVVLLNGLEQRKGADVVWVSATQFSLSIDVLAGDIIIVKP